VQVAEPEMRAAQTQSLLHTLGRLPSADRTEIMKRIGSSAVERAKGVLPVSFLPMSLHMHISDCVRDVVGPERNVAVWRDAMVTSFSRPFLKSFVAMTVSLFGVTPAGLLKRGDRVYEHITRRLGTLRFEAVPDLEHEGLIKLQGFPADRYRFVCYVEGLAGCLEAILDVCRTPGGVRVLDQHPRGDVTYAVQW
jgi:hypothetical protein